MSEPAGYAFALAAAVAFGVQYVPVKKYEIFDGTTFQWFMCNGILMVGCVMSIITGDIHRGVSSLCMMGGALWALSNYIVIPLVKLLGIGLGFSLYHFVNLVVGYCVGRFGLFGLPKLQPQAKGGLMLCDFGCLLLLVGFTIMVFVETGPGAGNDEQPKVEDGEEAPHALPPPLVEGTDRDVEVQEYRQRYRQWRLGEAFGVRDKLGRFLVEAVGVKQRGPVRFFQFGLYAEPQVGASASNGKGPPPTRSNGAASLDCSHDGAVGGNGGAFLPSQPWSAATLASAKLRSASEPMLLADHLNTVAEECGSRSPGAGGGAVSGAGAGAGGGARPSSRGGGGWNVGKRLLGVVLAIAGGVLCGVNNVPPSLYTLQHPHLTPFAAVFSQCLGIWMVSSLIYLVYSSLARLAKWPVPHSAIRPAYLSGCIWAVGFACMLGGIKNLGYSVGYTLDAVGPVVVSSLISIFVYKEITGVRQLSLFALSFVCQLCGVILIAAFGRA